MKAYFLVDDSRWHQDNLLEFATRLTALGIGCTTVFVGQGPSPELPGAILSLDDFCHQLTAKGFGTRAQLQAVLDESAARNGDAHYTGIPVIKLFFPLVFDGPFWVLDTDLYLLPATDATLFAVDAGFAAVIEDSPPHELVAGAEKLFVNAGVLYWHPDRLDQDVWQLLKQGLVSMIDPRRYKLASDACRLGEEGVLNHLLQQVRMRTGKDITTVLPEYYNLSNNYKALQVFPSKGIVHFKGSRKPLWQEFESKRL